MLIKVENSFQQSIFKELWDEIREEKGFDDDPYVDYSNRYLIQSENEYIGTIEFTPFKPEVFSMIEDLFTFSENPKVQQHKNRTFEMDRLSLKKGWRGKGFVEEIFEAIYINTVRYNVKYYVGAIDPIFLRALRSCYGVESIEKLGNPIRNKKSLSIPVLFDIEKFIQGTQEDWAHQILSKYQLPKKVEINT